MDNLILVKGFCNTSFPKTLDMQLAQVYKSGMDNTTPKIVSADEIRTILARDGKPLSRERIHQIAIDKGWEFCILPGSGRPKGYALSDVLAYLANRPPIYGGAPRKVKGGGFG